MNATGNNTVIKLMEEMKMATTVMGRTKAYKAWVGTQVDILESLLSLDATALDSFLYGREVVREDVFNKKFQYEYARIKEAVEEATWRAKDANIPNDVLEDAINKFKEIKTRVRKTKSAYKQAFSELREAIHEAKESISHVEETADLIQKMVVQWCETHEIISYLQKHFVGEGLVSTVKYLTDWLLSTKLYPNEDEIRTFVETYMKSHSIRVA